MGGLQVWRTFMMNVFWRHFYEMLPLAMRRFHVGMIDGMQYTAPRVLDGRNERVDCESVARRNEEIAVHFMNAEEDPQRPVFERALIFMLDTVHNVPKNKAGKQRSRDGTEASHMDEAMFEAMRAQCPPLFESLFITNNTRGTHAYPLAGPVVWRSENLKRQLYRLLTFRLLHVPVKPGMVLIVDDGVACSLTDYERERARLIAKHKFGDRSVFEQECMVQERMTRSKKKSCVARFMVWSDGQYMRFPATGIGEADIKIQHYISRENGAQRFLVVNQDTDIIFILLLHMHTFLYHDERDDEIEVWLDTRSPSDKTATRPYRYIDIKRLYQAIVALFAVEYPHVAFPVQTFCFLVFALETDFTRKFPACLKISPAQLWNIFSELHQYDVAPLLRSRGFIRFSQSTTVSPTEGAIVRATQRTLSPELYGMLNEAIHYDSIKKRYYLRHEQIKRFYYLACQMRVMAVRADIGVRPLLSARQAALVTALEPAELLIYAADIIERLEYYKKNALRQPTLEAQMNLLKHKMEETDTMMQKEPVVSVPQRKARKPETQVVAKFVTGTGGWLTPNAQYQRQSVAEEIEEILDSVETTQPPQAVEEEGIVTRLGAYINTQPAVLTSDNTQLTIGYIQQNEKKLYEYTKNDMPPAFFGVSTESEMLARIYRFEWYISYCTDGWRHPGPYGAVSCVERARHDPSLSVWGWKEVRSGEPSLLKNALNSTYFTTHFMPESRTFEVSEIVECDEVSHRRVYR